MNLVKLLPEKVARALWGTQFYIFDAVTEKRVKIAGRYRTAELARRAWIEAVKVPTSERWRFQAVRS